MQLVDLLTPPTGERFSRLDRLRRAPTRISPPAMVAALDRVGEIRALGMSQLNLARIPPGRLTTLARYAAAGGANSIARMPEERRIATLVAFAYIFEAIAQDDSLDLLDQLITECLTRAEKQGQKHRLHTLPQLDAAALRMREVCRVVLDPKCPDSKVRASIFESVARSQLEADVDIVGELSRTEQHRKYYEQLLGRYSTVRRFLPALLLTIHFEAAAAGQPVLKAREFMKKIEGKPKADMDKAPKDVLNAAWRKVVTKTDRKIDRRFYTFCVLERLQDALRRRDVYVTPSERWDDPRAKLLHGQTWEAARPDVCRMLDLPLKAQPALGKLGKQLDEGYRRVAANMPRNPAFRIKRIKGKDRPVLAPLDKLDEPQSLVELRNAVDALLPRVDITDAILELHGWTGFAHEFTHISESNARVRDLEISICAVLAAEECNTRLEPFVRSDVPALTYRRLLWVQQNYIRPEMLIRGNGRLVDAQSQIPLAQAFGGGEVASADGLRFAVPVRTLNAGPSSEYYPGQRGLTYYNFTSNQFSGFHGIPVPGAVRDSPYVLDGLLEQQTGLQPHQLITDTAGYSDIIFGLFWLLGYQFSPRLADLGETRFWRMDPTANYGPLNGLARNRLKPALVSRNWDDFLRVAGSLKMGTVKASEFIRSLQRGGKQSLLGCALGELGRIPKTLHLLTYVDDELYRRGTLTQLNRHEGRHSLARIVFHGQRGEFRQRYREGQEDQLGALGLVLNALILWNTRYMEAALSHLRASGWDVKLEDVARLAPLGSGHFNVLGRYDFHVTNEILKRMLRPLRSPENVTDYEGVIA